MNAELVERLVDLTAYEIVKLVAGKIPEIEILANNSAQLSDYVDEAEAAMTLARLYANSTNDAPIPGAVSTSDRGSRYWNMLCADAAASVANNASDILGIRVEIETLHDLVVTASEVVQEIGNAPFYASLADPALPVANSARGWMIIPGGVDEGIYRDNGTWGKVFDTQAIRAKTAADRAEAAANSASSLRQSLIDLGVAQLQSPESHTTAGFIQTPQYSNPAIRRTVVRGAETITMASTLEMGMAIGWEGQDLKPGRVITAEARINAYIASVAGLGLLIVPKAKADAARADATDLTFTTASANPDATYFLMRPTGIIEARGHTVVGGALGTFTSTRVKESSGSAYSANDVLRFKAALPVDGADRRIDIFRQAGGIGPFVAAGYIVIDEDFWPIDAEPMIAAYGNDDVNWTVLSRTVEKADEPSDAADAMEVTRYVSHAAPAGGDGMTAQSPVQTLAEAMATVPNTAKVLRVIGNGGGIYRMNAGISIAHDRFERIEILGDDTDAPDFRLSRISGAWVQDGANPTVWETDNYWGGVISAANGGYVMCYDTSEIPLIHDPRGSRKMLFRSANNTSAAALAALGYPATTLVTATSKVRMALPGGENPNNLITKLELVQADRLIELAGPLAGGGTMRRPVCKMRNVRFSGGVTNTLRASVWEIDWQQASFYGVASDTVELRECSGVTHGFRGEGCINDCLKANPYDPPGAAVTNYSDALRPTVYFFDAALVNPGYAGLGDCVSTHENGGRFVFIGGFMSAPGMGKHLMSMIDSFESYGTRFYGGYAGGIVVAFAASQNGRFVIKDPYFEDCAHAGNLGAIQINRPAGATGVTEGEIINPVFATPQGHTDRGIQIVNSATPDKIVLKVIDPKFDSAIPENMRRVAFNAATVTERTLVS